MNVAKTSTNDLLLKIVDGPEDSIIPVKSTTCLLKETQRSGAKSECMLLRDESGVQVKSASEGVTINGAPAFGQRLQAGDRIQLGSKAYEITQLGSLSSTQQQDTSTHSSAVKPTVVGERIQLVRVRDPKTKSRTKMIEQLKQAEPQMSSDQINSRIDRIESELGRQSDNFENVNKRFDDLSGQMSALISSLSNNAVAQPTAEEADALVDSTQPETLTEETFSLPSQASGTNESTAPCTIEHALEAIETPTSELETTEPEFSNEKSEDLTPEVTQTSALDAVFGNQPQQTESSESTSEVPVLDVQDASSQPENADEGLEVTASSPDDLMLDSFTQNDCDDTCSGECEEPCQPTVESSATGMTEQEKSLSEAFQNFESASQETFDSADSTSVDESEDTGERYESEEQHQPLTDEENQRMLDRLSALTGANRTSEESDTDQEVETSSAVAEVSNQQLEDDAEKTLDGLLSSLDSIGGATAASEELGATAEPFASELNTEEQPESAASEETTEEPDKLESLFASLREKDRLVDEQNEELQATSSEDETADSSLSSGLLESLANDEPDKPVLSLREQMGLGNADAATEETESFTDTDSLSNESELLAAVTADEEDKPSLSLREQMGLSDLVTAESTPDENELTDNLVSEQEPVQVEAVEEQPGNEADSDTESSVADILARMNMMPTDGQEDGAAGIVEDIQPEPIQPEPVQASEAEVAEPQSGEDVQDYMNSLLQRLNGGEAPAKPAAESKPEAKQPVAQPEAEVEPVAPAIPLEPLNEEDFVPSASAPERTKDLAAMRKLANASSRNAVQRSKQKQKKMWSNNLLIIAIAGVIGAALTAMLSSQTGDGYYMLAIALFAVTAIASGLYVASNYLGIDVSFSKLLSFLPKSKKQVANGLVDGVQDLEVVDATNEGGN